MIRRRLGAAAGACGVVVAALLALASGTAHAQAPDVAAWWNVANVGNGAPAPPAPPDVPAGDLLVQGSNPSSSVPTTPLSNAPATASAIAGLSFALPANATVGKLTLQLDGPAPPQVSVVACRATRTFFAEENGVWTDVPPYDCSQTVAGTLDGSTLVFADVTKLVQNDTLEIVLLPGPVDRIVVKKPDDNALQVSSAGGIGAPPLGTGIGSGGPIGGSAGGSGGFGQPVAPVGGPAVLPPAGTGTGGVVPPVVAPSATPSAVGSHPVASAATADGGLTVTQRRTLAAVVIALEILGFLLMLADRRGAGEAVAAGEVALAGGRLRPPDRGGRTVAGQRSGGVVVAGVGRFRGPREGSAPRL